jgi:hypothetical protein
MCSTSSTLLAYLDAVVEGPAIVVGIAGQACARVGAPRSRRHRLPRRLEEGVHVLGKAYVLVLRKGTHVIVHTGSVQRTRGLEEGVHVLGKAYVLVLRRYACYRTPKSVRQVECAGCANEDGLKRGTRTLKSVRACPAQRYTCHRTHRISATNKRLGECLCDFMRTCAFANRRVHVLEAYDLDVGMVCMVTPRGDTDTTVYRSARTRESVGAGPACWCTHEQCHTLRTLQE